VIPGLRPLRGLRPGLCCPALSALEAIIYAIPSAITIFIYAALSALEAIIYAIPSAITIFIYAALSALRHLSMLRLRRWEYLSVPGILIGGITGRFLF
jgi:hypothetical protein